MKYPRANKPRHLKRNPTAEVGASKRTDFHEEERCRDRFTSDKVTFDLSQGDKPDSETSSHKIMIS